MRAEWQWIKFAFRATLFLLVLPFRVGRWLGWIMVRLVGVWVLSTRDALGCPGCGSEQLLLGRWQCAWCEFVFDGFAFARCPNCFAVPPFIECQNCGASVRNPLS